MLNPYTDDERKQSKERGSTVDTIRDTARQQGQITRSKSHSYNQVSSEMGGIQFVSSSLKASAGGNSLAGVEVLWADGTYTYISVSDILDDYDDEDYWSIAFDVSNNTFAKTYAYDDTEAQWNDTGTSQTVYRLRVITQNGDGDPVSTSLYGQYRESIICRNGEAVTVLTKAS